MHRYIDYHVAEITCGDSRASISGLMFKCVEWISAEVLFPCLQSSYRNRYLFHYVNTSQLIGLICKQCSILYIHTCKLHAWAYYDILHSLYIECLRGSTCALHLDRKCFQVDNYQHKPSFVVYWVILTLCTWCSSLPVTPVQLMRPGIGRNVSCAVGDFA